MIKIIQALRRVFIRFSLFTLCSLIPVARNKMQYLGRQFKIHVTVTGDTTVS